MSEGFLMPVYMYQAAYTAESMAAQIREPHDRIEAVKPAFEALGATFVAAGHPFGEFDILVIFDAPDDTVAASIAMAVGAGGAVRSAKTTRLLTGQEWVESLRKAQGTQYKPAR
ncbi:MAG TPA: GYD domain-containing protein [Streptosporangiaceae bacterium]|nr:GYD domain-containing protein [Streptosporangiaceae bacterium]